MKKKIAVLGVQVPFIRGGAELLNDELVRQINLRGDRYNVEAELIQLPYKWYPSELVLQNMVAWKLLDLSESNGEPIDLVIGTKFPSYLAEHTNKVLWLVHQHRGFYDLEGTSYDHPEISDLERAVRDKVRRGDTLAVQSCRARFSIAETVSARLRRFNDLDAQVLYPPPKLRDQIQPGEYGDYILYVGRAEQMKRVDLLIEALALEKRLRAIVIGKGNHLPRLIELASKLGVEDRCEFKGYVPDDTYLDCLAGARAVYYGPFDEDYGFATVEAFLAEKPVLTFADGGEPAVMVARTDAGWIAREPTAHALAASCMQAMAASDSELRALGRLGREFAESIHWDSVFHNLVEVHL